MNERRGRLVTNGKRMQMKITRYLIVSAVAMALATPVLLLAAAPASAASNASPNRNLSQRMQQLDNQLDSIFAKTFRDFGDPFSNSAFASSSDLREQRDRYVVRVYVPDADTSKVSAKVEGNTLHVSATGGRTTQNSSASERYEQIVRLPGPVQEEKMKIERKPNLVIVSLPKAAAAGTPSRGQDVDQFAGVDQKIIQQMARMQQRMNQMFDQAFAGDDDNDLTSAFQGLNFGSAVHVDDQPNDYVVHFNLPNNDLQDVQVKLENGQLRVTAAESEEQKSSDAQSLRSGEFEQLFTLPGPVQEKGMKVERNNGTIVVTVPKA